MRWTVVASGPSGKGLTAAELRGTVICVNNSIKWVDRSLMDVYFFRRGFHHEQFDDLIEKGVRLVAFRRRNGLTWTPKMPMKDWMKIQRLEQLGMLHTAREYGLPDWVQYVEQIKEEEIAGWSPFGHEPKVPKWEVGTYTKQIDPIGPSAIQYALNHGAGSIHIFGMEGGIRESDGSLTQAMEQSANYHWAAMQGCINACPTVEFVVYGDTLYQPLEGDNVRMTECQPGA